MSFRQKTLTLALASVTLALVSSQSFACTTLIVGKDASATGMPLLGHNEDAGGRVMHQQFFYPAAQHQAGEVLEAEPGTAKIPQVKETLDTYWSNMLDINGSSFDQGFSNGAGVIFCSNAGGKSFDSQRSDQETLKLKDGGIGFLLRRATMERAHTAREAVEIAGKLVEEWGYFGTARNYSFADKNEVWIFNAVKGHHWVAKKVPSDRVLLISNELAIRHVDVNDKENVMCSPDLVEWAIKHGRYTPKKAGDYSDFDFAKAYQPDSERDNPMNSIRLQTGWKFLTGKYFTDVQNFPETQKLDRKLTVQDVQALLRLSDPDNLQTRGDNRADAFHTNARDISRSQTRETWVMELREKPWLNTLWHCDSYQDTGVYIPWFVMAGKIPVGYNWTSIDEAHKVQFNMNPDYLDLDFQHSYFIYSVLGELVNFNRGLIAGVHPVRNALEADFAKSVEKVRAKAIGMNEADAKVLLAKYTQYVTTQADSAYRKLLANINTIKASIDDESISVSDKNKIVKITIKTSECMPFNEIDPNTLYWSVGFTGSTPAVDKPAKPIKIEREGDKVIVQFKAYDAAQFGIPGVKTDTYLRGYADNRRFVAMIPVDFEK